MIKNKLKRTLLCSALAIGVVSSVSTSAFATEVSIETKATTVNVNVPSTMAVVFNEDGTNTLPSDFTVTNNSKIAGVSLVKIDVDAGSTGWQFCKDTVDLKTRPADTKEIQFTAGKQGVTKLVAPTSEKGVTASAIFNSGEISIPASGSETLAFSMERVAFKQAESSSKAFDMTLTFDFN